MVELLITEFIIERNIRNMVYLWSGGCLVLFLIILWRMGLTRRALWAVGVSFVINIGWEISLFLTEARAYESGFPFLLEFIYHGFTELAPFVLFWMICLKLFGFIGKDGEVSADDREDEERVYQNQGNGEEERAGDSGDPSWEDTVPDLGLEEEDNDKGSGDAV